MIQTDVQLTSRATIVQNEVEEAANTALRVGSLLIDMIANKFNINTADTDITLAANSDAKLATQKAVKGYVDALVTNAVQAASTALLPAGTTDLWAGAPGTIPAGWLLCDGAEVNRVAYASLFTAIGVLYGVGNGTTTFNLPNMRKRVVAGYDAGDTDYNATGKTGGANGITITDQQIAHKHAAYSWKDDGTDGHSISDGTDFYEYEKFTSSLGNTAIARDLVDVRNSFIVLPYKIKT